MHDFAKNEAERTKQLKTEHKILFKS